MTENNADIAYRIAEKRIDEAIFNAQNSVVLSPRSITNGNVVLDAEPLLSHLEKIPPNISKIKNLIEVDLFRTSINDLKPLTSINTIVKIDLSDTNCDLYSLVGEGSVWRESDLSLQQIEIWKHPLTREGEIFGETYFLGLKVTKRTEFILSRLRHKSVSDQSSAYSSEAVPPAPDRPFVSLSYTSADAAKAAALRAALEADGVPIWQDVEMRAGARFREEIAQRIDAAAAVLVLWSEASVASDFVTSEAERARLAGKLVPALIEECAVPAPFDVFDTVDLIANWRIGVDPDGEGLRPFTHTRVYQTLLASLRERLTPGAEVGATLDDNRKIIPAQKPVGVSPPNDDALALARAIRIQIALVDSLGDKLDAANIDNRIRKALPLYRKALSDNDPLWEIVDNEFAGFHPLLGEAEGLHEGIEEQARRLKTQHIELEAMLRPEQPAEKPTPIDRETPEEAAPEAMELIEEAATVMDGAEDFAPASPEFLRHEYGQVKQAREDAGYEFDEESAQRRRRFLTKSVVAAAGFIGSVGALASTAQFVLSPQGQAAMTRLGEIWVQLMRLVFG